MTALFALLWARERTGRGGRSEVSLVEALAPYADALRYGLLAPGTLLGGGSPLYGLYRAASGWVALAALEPHFAAKLARGLDLAELDGGVVGAGLSRPACPRVGSLGGRAGHPAGRGARSAVSTIAGL